MAVLTNTALSPLLQTYLPGLFSSLWYIPYLNHSLLLLMTGYIFILELMGLADLGGSIRTRIRIFASNDGMT